MTELPPLCQDLKPENLFVVILKGCYCHRNNIGTGSVKTPLEDAFYVSKLFSLTHSYSWNPSQVFIVVSKEIVESIISSLMISVPGKTSIDIIKDSNFQ